jgi:GT2 family glycosyltransferase
MAVSNTSLSATIVIPTYNGATRIGRCLECVLNQTTTRSYEVVVVDDGSTDQTASVARSYPGVRVISQVNRGPAAARNRGAAEAHGEILVFTDDDCEPLPDWLERMLAPFDGMPDIVGSKGAYLSRQRPVTARFVQLEYEDKYRRLARFQYIDFIDTYAAAFRRESFIAANGYDTSFPVPCAEDVDLSYRLAHLGHKMVFIPEAKVYHRHPERLWDYLKKKYKFAFWRVLAVRKTPEKAVSDSHTPQLMKLQLLFLPATLGLIVVDLTRLLPITLWWIPAALMLATTLPFAVRAFRKDPLLGLLSPLILIGRACAQFLGVAAGLFRARAHEPQLEPHRAGPG